MGLDSSCADVVLVQERDGVLSVPLIRRAKPPFQGMWWLTGGAIFNYRPVHQFLLWKALKEGGLTTLEIDDFVREKGLEDDTTSCGGIHIVGCFGVARTAAEDTDGLGLVCDTMNNCYLGIAERDVAFHHDRAHDDIRWVTTDTLGDLGHWYPEWAARRALDICIEARKA